MKSNTNQDEHNMGFNDDQEEEVLEPMSPSAQYLKSSALSLTVISVLEFQDPIDDSKTIPLVRDVFLPINHRFSSVMVINSCPFYFESRKKVEILKFDLTLLNDHFI